MATEKRQRAIAKRVAVWHETALRILAQIADENDLVDRCHGTSPFVYEN